MDSSNPQCRVRQCFKCEGSTVFFCFMCDQNLCGPCRRKHLHDLSTTHHETHHAIVNRVKLGKRYIVQMCRIHPDSSYIYCCERCKLPLCDDCKTEHELHQIIPIYDIYSILYTPSHIIRTIRSEDLFKRLALMVEIQSDIKKLNRKMPSHKHLSNMFTKAQKLKQLIDKVVYDRNKCVWILQNQKMRSHIATIQKYEHSYEESSIKPTQFISFLKTSLSNIQSGPKLAQSSHLSLTESLNEENVIRFICAFTLSDRGERRLGNESLLELMPKPELQQLLKLNDTSGCLHMSRVRPDQFWVSDNRNNLILLNKNGDIQKHFQNEIYTHVYDLTGAHTVDRNNQLIYIDTNNQIIRFINREINTLCFEDNDNQWIYRCVFSSQLTGNLLIGMSNEDSSCSKITQYTIKSSYLGKLVQTIQYDNAGTELYVGPCYITENNNGDVVVSDWKNGVVVTDSRGRHRFTFKKDPYGSVVSPKGICTDPLSQILVCVLHKVMVLDKDGQFISYILSMPPEIMIVTNSLSLDSNTHCLWIGSVSDGRVHAYKYLKRRDALLGMYASVL